MAKHSSETDAKNPGSRVEADLHFAIARMQVQVETYVDEGGAEKVRRFRLDSRVVEVADNIDQWYGADYRYVKVKGSDGNVYILRHNEIRAEWELTMYERSQSQGAPRQSDIFFSCSRADAVDENPNIAPQK